MGLVSFKGGIHPRENKEWTEGKAVENLPLPERVFLPLSQHIGAPAKAVVKPGDQVKTGQLVAEAGGFVSAPVHATISGTVKAVAPHAHAMGRPQLAIEIERAGDEDDWDTTYAPIQDLESADRQILKDRIQAAGIVGMGGATFPTHVKLNPPEGKTIDALIINAAECEPYITSDHRLMLEEPERVIRGIKIFMRALGLDKAYIGIENNKPDAIKKLTELCKSEKGIEVSPLKVKYPQGAEKQLIMAILGRAVPAGGLPMDIGALVQNVATSAAISDAVNLGRPLIERIVTVSGAGIKDKKNLRVRFGTPISELINHCRGIQGEPGMVIMGGPMMGLAQSTLAVPAIKGTNAVLVFPKDELHLREPGPCIRCGSCVKACPMFLQPNALGLLVRRDRIDEAEEIRIMDCMECGSCSYVCPSDIPLVHLFRYAKGEVLAKRRKAEKKKK